MNNSFHSGFVSIIGRPNAGKSTLLNAFVGQKVAIVADKPQTTRTSIQGVATTPDSQIVFLDTPGIHKADSQLNKRLMDAVRNALEERDLLLFVADATREFTEQDRRAVDVARKTSTPVILVLNKVDLVKKEALLALATQLNDRLSFEDTYMVSAATGDGVADLKAALAARVPEGPWHFPADQVSDASDRMTAAEITREQLYLQLHAELPHQSAVETERYEERRDGSVAIHQQILIGRDSQKAIILGKGGTRIRAIGEAARAELAQLLGRKVHLFLHVKVNPKWDEDRALYREIGLDWTD